MSRTYRRKSDTHEYRWVLRDYIIVDLQVIRSRLDPHSEEGRRALARFHSDKNVTMTGGPRLFRKYHDRKIRTYNNKMMLKWKNNQEFEPVFQTWHKHVALWMWW